MPRLRPGFSSASSAPLTIPTATVRFSKNLFSGPLSAVEKSCGSLRSTSSSIEPTSLQAIWLKHLSGTLVNKLTLLERCGARPLPVCEDFWCAQPQASLHLRLSLSGRSNTKADFLTCDTLATRIILAGHPSHPIAIYWFALSSHACSASFSIRYYAWPSSRSSCYHAA